MLTKFSLHDKFQCEEWDEFVKGHPNGSPFQLTCWLRVIHDSYSFEPLLYVYKNPTGDISGILPFFLINTLFTPSHIVSIPFSDYGGPLFKDQHKEKDVLIPFLEEYRKKIKYLEIRGTLSKDAIFMRQNYYKRHILHLSPNPDVVRRNIDKKTVQYSIRKAEKVGVEIREENTTRGLQEFYRLNNLTRKKHGIPPQPMKFFETIFDNIISRGCASIFLATYDSQAIAAGLFLKFKKTIYYKYNVSDPQYLSKKSPNHLLTWFAIKQACVEGFELLDFGRTSPDNEGLMRYKEMWGATRQDLPYYYYPKIKNITMEGSRIYRILTGIWRMLPNRIVETVGPKLQKYVA